MNDERLEQLLAEFWARREDGEALTPSAFLGEHAADAAALQPALAALLGTAALLPAADLPASIGGYRVEVLLGRGAAGEVFAVADAAGRPLALKRLLPHVAAARRSQQRLQREAAVLRGLRHPNLVEVVDVGDDGGRPFVVMQRVDGGSLAALIAAARRDGAEAAFAALPGGGSRWQRIAGCMAALARALAAAHAAGVLHRDLKPGNVLLQPDGTPVLADFGLAADADAATLTATGEVLGTPHYMAPEQARGRPADAQSDVYGLGAILYELLTLSPPRRGADPLQVLVAARSEPPPPPRHLAPDVPRELELIARRAMAFRPRQRFAGAAQMAAALQQVADGVRPLGLTLGFATRLDEYCRRRRRPLVAALALLLVGATTAIALDLRDAARAHAQAEAAQTALVAAVESHLDGDAGGVAAAAPALRAGGESALAAWLLRGEAAAGDAFVQALAAGHRALADQPAAAAEALQRAVRLRPSAPVAWAWLGIAAEAAGDWPTAERELMAAVRELPRSVRLRVAYARALHQQKRTGEAVAQLEQAVLLPRATADTWHELAKRCVGNRDPQRALAAVDRAIELHGPREDASMLRTKAVIFDGLDRQAEAAPLLARIAALHPSANTWTSYGMVLDRMHAIDRAAEAYRRALGCDRKHVPALVCLVYLHAGSNPDCADCRRWFAEHPQLRDPAAAEDYAIAALQAQEGDYAMAERLAGYLRQGGRGERFAAALQERLQRDLPPAALGHLLRARRVLRGE